MAGRRPKLTSLRIVGGNPGKRAINKTEPRFKQGVSNPPETLDGVDAQCWKRLSILLDRTGVLTEPDEFALERMYDVYADVLACKALIERDGRTYTATGTDGSILIKQNPPAQPSSWAFCWLSEIN